MIRPGGTIAITAAAEGGGTYALYFLNAPNSTLPDPNDPDDTFRRFFPGDMDLNGRVDIEDFITLKQNYGASPADWFTGDMDGDRDVDISDFIILKQHYGSATPPAQALRMAGIPAVEDFDADGEITMSDFETLARRLGYRI